MERPLAGFTLLEVLVAVGVLGLLYTALTGVAMQGLRAEGESARELRASLLADHELAERELQVELGIVPPVGREPEREEDEFLVEVDVEPLPLELPNRSPRGEREDADGAPAASLLHGRGSEASLLRHIEVRVSWTEGIFEREVRRTSFALDRAAAAPILESLAASQEAREEARDEKPQQDEKPERQPPVRDDQDEAEGAE